MESNERPTVEHLATAWRNRCDFNFFRLGTLAIAWDMLAALRRHLWAERNIREPSHGAGATKFYEAMLESLCAG